MTHVYLLYGDAGERELAAAEVVELSNGRQRGKRMVEALRRIDVVRAGYVACGLDLLAYGPTLDDACRELERAGVASDRFAIDVRRIPRHLPVPRREVAGEFAFVIDGRPDLDHPLEWFAAFVTEEGIWFGRRLDPGQRDWERFVRKPYDCSSALPARAARAVCNLVIRGGERVLDPCCGSGTLLLNAASLGASVTGFDINPKMVGATNKNLMHFGFEPAASVGDAAEVRGEYDVVLANLPYGQMSAISEEEFRRVVSNVLRLAPRGMLIATADLSAEIRASGAQVAEFIHHRKFSLTRLIHVFERPGRAGGR